MMQEKLISIYIRSCAIVDLPLQPMSDVRDFSADAEGVPRDSA